MMISILMNPDQEVLIGLMFLASFRVYLEIIGFNFLELPMTKQLAKVSSVEYMRRFHRVGLIFSLGFIVLFAPQLLLAS